MKKISLILVAIGISVLCNAQEDNDVNSSSNTIKKTMNKNGQIMVPEAGDICIGVNATPFFGYISSVFGFYIIDNTGSLDPYYQSPSFAFTSQNPGEIYGKYMLTDLKAFRFSLRIGMDSYTDKDGTGVSNSDIDLYKTSALYLGLSLGIEQSRTIKNRIRGFYGAQFIFDRSPFISNTFSSSVIGRYEYIAYDGNGNFVQKGGETYSAGIGGILGVEYFIAPKISLSGEFGLNIMYDYQTQRKQESSISNTMVVDPGGSGISLDNAASGDLSLLFYF